MMSDYRSTEKRINRERKPQTTACGQCGEPCERGRWLCESCAKTVFFDPQAGYILEKEEKR